MAILDFLACMVFRELLLAWIVLPVVRFLACACCLRPLMDSRVHNPHRQPINVTACPSFGSSLACAAQI